MRLRIYGLPVAQGRPRLTTRGGFAHAYDPAKSREWKRTVHIEAAREVAKAAARFPLEGPLALVLCFYMPRPKSLPRRVTHHTKRPDVDNLAKAVQDAIGDGCVYRDDAQIVSLLVTKEYDEKPGVGIDVQSL